MYRIWIENKYKDKIELTHNPNYEVKVTGLNPMTSDIITSKVANYGGKRYVTSRQQTRNIVLTVYIKESVEANRINLYKYVRSKDFIRVYYQNNTRNVYIDGYVESFECDFFTQTQTAQISIICPKPQLIDVTSEITTLASTIGAFSFPFYVSEEKPVVFSYYDNRALLINNTSDDDIGFICKIQCYDKVVNPMLYLEETGAYFKLNRRFSKGSIIIINSNNGTKSVKCELRGITTNIINSLDSGSTWLKLQAGYNHILQTADSGLDSMVSEISYTNEYEGV